MPGILIDLLQQALSGFMYGSAYALIALGFTLIWGVLRRLNLAYGPTVIAGAYVGLAAAMFGKAPIPLVFLACLAGSTAVGFVVEYCCFRPLRNAPELAHVMSTIGMLILLEETIVRLTAAYPFSFPNPLELVSVTFGPFFLRGDLVALLLAGLCLAGTLFYVIYRTRFGRAMRAMAENPRMALLLGVEEGRVMTLTILLTSLLGGATGFFVAMSIGALKPDLGSIITIKGLVVMILGGLGSIPGAIVGGFLLGIVEFEALGFLGVGYRDIFAYLVLFALLIFRPQGLLGEGTGDRA